jgi:spore germination protein YaaH
VQALLAALLSLGPHAADALAHAQDAPAAWVSMPPPQGTAAASAATVALPKRVYGYLPYWESIDLNAFRWDLITDIIAFSVDVGADGTVSNPHGLPGGALLSSAHANGVRVHLCATLFNTSGGNEVATFLASASARAAAVQRLMALAPDGINLDYEFVPTASRGAFTAFVQQLREALPQAVELTLAMPASASYGGYDVAALASLANRLLLMEYDYHWRTGPAAGPVAPLASVENAVDGYLALAPVGAIAMGVPYYGYEWPTTSLAAGAATAGTGTSVLFDSAFTKFATYGRVWDSPSQTPWYSFASAGQPRQGWVEDGESLSLKYRFARTRDLAGVMIWALGYDGTRAEAWAALQSAYFPEVPIQPPPRHGCSQAGATPAALLILALFCLRRRFRPHPGARVRK